MESYNGLIFTPLDAITLIEAARLGKIPLVKQRLNKRTRTKLIKSGAVFIWEEKSSSMQRWTDGKYWTSSRVAGSFLTYNQIDAIEKVRLSLLKKDELLKQRFALTLSNGEKYHMISYASLSYFKDIKRTPPQKPKLTRPSEDVQFASITFPRHLYVSSIMESLDQVAQFYNGGISDANAHNVANDKWDSFLDQDILVMNNDPATRKRQSILEIVPTNKRPALNPYQGQQQWQQSVTDRTRSFPMVTPHRNDFMYPVQYLPNYPALPYQQQQQQQQQQQLAYPNNTSIYVDYLRSNQDLSYDQYKIPNFEQQLSLYNNQQFQQQQHIQKYQFPSTIDQQQQQQQQQHTYPSPKGLESTISKPATTTTKSSSISSITSIMSNDTEDMYMIQDNDIVCCGGGDTLFPNYAPITPDSQIEEY